MSQEEGYERLGIEQALQDELESIQSEVLGEYYDKVKTAIENILINAGFDKASVTEVSVEPPDNIIPSQNSTCFNVHVPKVANVKICIPS